MRCCSYLRARVRTSDIRSGRPLGRPAARRAKARRLREPLVFGLAIAVALAAPDRGSHAQQPSYTSDFTVLSRGVSIGTESVTVTPSADGWLISAIGSL